jgi:pSer/pThr/pTyr-binding forkhead associated (FHA) protein
MSSSDEHGPAPHSGRSNDTSSHRIPARVDPTTMRLSGLDEPGHQVDSDDVPTAADQATVEALRPGTALLVVLRGANTGARFLLDADTVTSGRHPDSDIFLDDVTVSRKHATFQREHGGFVVADVGSLNGTYVNRKRIDAAELHNGDEVQIGKFRLVFYGSSAGRREHAR